LQQDFAVEGFYIICWLEGTLIRRICGMERKPTGFAGNESLDIKKPTYLNNKLHKIKHIIVTKHNSEA
jgi:hypothetical protein